MDFKLIIDKNHKEEVIVYAKSETNLVKEIAALIENDKSLFGYKKGEVIKIELNQVYCFTIEGNKLFAIMENEKIQLKQRLYQIEEVIDENFIKINQSSIANLKRIDRFSASLGGSIVVTFKNGYRDYISRRQSKFVKERLGLK